MIANETNDDIERRDNNANAISIPASRVRMYENTFECLLLVRKVSVGHFEAKSVRWPEIVGFGATQEQASNRVANSYARRLKDLASGSGFARNLPADADEDGWKVMSLIVKPFADEIAPQLLEEFAAWDEVADKDFACGIDRGEY